MRDPGWLAGKPVIVALFGVAVCALVAATTLTVVVAGADGPDRCCPAPAAAGGLPSPTSRAPASRAAGVPTCLIGSWRSVDEVSTIKFYTDQPPMQFATSGRYLEFRPDGTGAERHDNVVHSSNFRGNQLRIVSNGSADFRWSATDKVITYIATTARTVSYAFYDQRGLLSTQTPPANPNLNEQDPYTCEPTRLVEDNPQLGYRSVWVRTAAAGVYG